MTPVEAQEAWGRVHGWWEACVEEREAWGHWTEVKGEVRWA